MWIYLLNNWWWPNTLQNTSCLIFIIPIVKQWLWDCFGFIYSGTYDIASYCKHIWHGSMKPGTYMSICANTCSQKYKPCLTLRMFISLSTILKPYNMANNPQNVLQNTQTTGKPNDETISSMEAEVIKFELCVCSHNKLFCEYCSKLL